MWDFKWGKNEWNNKWEELGKNNIYNQYIIAHSVKDKYSSSETSQNDADHDSENS